MSKLPPYPVTVKPPGDYVDVLPGYATKKTNKTHVSIKSIIKDQQKKREKQLKEEKKYKTITIQRVMQKGFEIVFIHVTDVSLKSWLQNYTQLASAYHNTPRLTPAELIPSVTQIKDHIEQHGCEHLRDLHKFLTYQLDDLLSVYEEMKSKNVISFDLLFCLFVPGTEVSFTQHDEVCGGIVQGFQTHCGWTGTTAEISVERITTNGRNFYTQIEKVRIKGFNGSIPIKELHIKPMDEQTKTTLTERGKKFVKYALGAHYIQYKGNLKIDNWFGSKYFRADGRIMIDAVSHDKRDSDIAISDNLDSSELFDSISDDRLAFHDPYLKGFSFSLKMWGGLTVSQMEDIQFNEKAFDTLVLDEEKKKIISALVRNVGVGFKDIIQGKSGGIIFNLAGNPGTGKTLTAEAIAETMKKPLYSVSIGELGISPSELEKKLREILEIAQTWNAVVLIDEADIFLEKRTENDIVRNAMVGIFLRLLEYHQGVLFLTTNRIKNFDEAFRSRISVSLNYKAHNKDGLRKIWNNLLNVAGLKNIDIEELLQYEVNGRQIKTSIRLAQALANDAKEILNINHIKKTISLQYEYTQKDLLKKGN